MYKKINIIPLQHRLDSVCGPKWRRPAAFAWCCFQEVETALTMPLVMKKKSVNFNFFPPPPTIS
jgi:hypothetical protein